MNDTRGAQRLSATFVGRGRERARLARWTASHPLVTVIGPAGVGKTRLVAEAVQGWDRRFPGGRWWLDLASIREPDLVDRFIADQLGLRPAPSRNLPAALSRRLAGQRTLLIFDNCEHLLKAVADTIRGLLTTSAVLVVLATSREPLAVSGEAVLPLDPLPTEDAVRLFIDRARLRLPDFQAVGPARVELTQLCERIDNLPLAVELAAARVAVLSPTDMLDRLDRRFELLTVEARDLPDRHKTLLAAIDWSFRLLSPPDQHLLSRLAALPGGFDLLAAEAVGGPGALDGLRRLIDKSLVIATPAERGTRYRLLEAVRDYGLLHLGEAGALHAVRDQLLDHFLASVEAAYEERMGYGSDDLLHLLADNTENLRAALEHGRATRPDAALRLAGAMREEWVRRNPSEGLLRLRRLIASHPDRDRHLGRGLLAVGHIAAMAEQAHEEGRAAFEQSREVCAEVGDTSGEAWATFYLGAAATLANDFATAERHLEQALILQEANSSLYGVLQARANLGQLRAISGQRLEEARHLLEDVLDTSRRLGNRWSTGHARTFLGVLELREQDPAAAVPWFRQAVGDFRAVGDQVMLAAALCGLARSLVPGDARQGLRLAAAASAIHGRLGSRFATVWDTLLKETRAQATAKLGTSAAEQVWGSGRRLSISEATELGDREPLTASAAGLTRRETQVTRLVAEGLSNRAVADRLGISERTAEAHVLHIMNKLGLANRSQIARWLYQESSNP